MPKPIDDAAETVVEFVYWPVILALAIGLAVGAAVFYLVTERAAEGAENA